MTSQEVALLKRKNALMVTDPKPNYSLKNPRLYKKIELRNRILSTFAVLGGLVAIPSVPVIMGALVSLALGSTTWDVPVTLLAISGVSVATLFIACKLEAPWLHAIIEVDELERDHVRQLLKANFGDKANLDSKFVNSLIKGADQKWRDEEDGKEYSAKYDKKTGLYTFFTQDVSMEAIPLPPREIFFGTVKPYVEKLKAFSAPDESQSLVDSILLSSSQLSQLKLDVEQEHQVHRLVVDASELVSMYEEFAVLDKPAADAKLLQGLQVLDAEASRLTASMKQFLAQEIEAHQNYMETRSLNA